MTDQQALEHIDQRMTAARDAEGRIATMRDIISQTRAAFNEAGVLSGPLPERVRKLSADLRDVAADRDRLRAELNAPYNIIADFDPGSDGSPARLRELLKARTPPAPDVAPGGVEWRGRELFVGGRYEGLTGFVGDGEWMVAFGNRQIDDLPNGPTARAVLLALAGQECGRVEFGLRESATWADLRKLKGGLLDWAHDVLVMGGKPSASAISPASVRAWVEHGQAALTISVPS